MFWLDANNTDDRFRAAAEVRQPKVASVTSSAPIKRNYTLLTILIIASTIIANQTSTIYNFVQCQSPDPRAPNSVRNLVLHHQSAEAPDFTEPIGNQTVAVGRDAQLSCKISNLGAYRTAWLRVEDKGILTIHTNVITRNYRFGLINDDNEQPTRNFVLSIKNVQPSDKGGYMCQINSVPMKSSVGYLDVLTPPVFDDAITTTASPLTAINGGEYVTTTIASSFSTDDSQAAASANSSQTTVVEGASATLTCRASGHPMPSITWRREDGRPILLNAELAGLDSSSSPPDDASAPTEIKDTTQLAFKTASRLSSGAYLCIASNGVQPSASKRQLLDVQFAPVITLPQTEVAAQLDQREAQLECLVELNPLGSYHWIKLATSTTNTDRRPMAANQEDDLWLIEHDELLQSDKFDIVIRQINSEKVQMILTIRRVERHDFSWYKCIAKNSLGLQSNFIRFYESTVPANTLLASATATAASATTTTTQSSSFSFNSIFRGSGGAQSPDAADSAAARQSGASGAGHNQPRAHSRSSWNQRSTGSQASSRSSASNGSLPGASLMLALVNLPILFLYGARTCHLIRPSYLVGITTAATGALLTLLARLEITLPPT